MSDDRDRIGDIERRVELLLWIVAATFVCALGGAILLVLSLGG